MKKTNKIIALTLSAFTLISSVSFSASATKLAHAKLGAKVAIINSAKQRISCTGNSKIVKANSVPSGQPTIRVRTIQEETKAHVAGITIFPLIAPKNRQLEQQSTIKHNIPRKMALTVHKAGLQIADKYLLEAPVKALEFSSIYKNKFIAFNSAKGKSAGIYAEEVKTTLVEEDKLELVEMELRDLLAQYKFEENTHILLGSSISDSFPNLPIPDSKPTPGEYPPSEDDT